MARRKIDPKDIEQAKKELINAYSDPEFTGRLKNFIGSAPLGKSMQNLKSAQTRQVKSNDDWNGLYDPDKNIIYFAPGSEKETGVHEFSHSYFANQDAKPFQSFIDARLDPLKKQQLYNEGKQEDYNYYADQEEIRAMLNEIRSERDPKNYKKKFSIKDLDDSDADATKILRRMFEDDKILELLNTLAEAKTMKKFANLT